MKDKDCALCNDTGNEYFSYLFGMYVFDVTKAIEVIKATPRGTQVLSKESVEIALGWTRTNEKHVAHVDETIPGIIAFFEHDGIKGHVLIDGHHRAAKCVQLGKEFRVCVLSPEESVACISENNAPKKRKKRAKKHAS